MPPVRALSADDLTEPFSLASLLACGKTLLGGTASRVAAAALVAGVAVTVAAPSAHRVEASSAARTVVAPVTFIPRRAPLEESAPHPTAKPAAVARPAPRVARPPVTKPPRAAPATAPAPPSRPAPAAPRAAPPQAAAPDPPAPTAPEPPPTEAPPHPVVPPLPPLPPVTNPGAPSVDSPSLPLGP